ncbi:MAG: SRPBCC family protein [Flavobacteriales bacterium]
MNNGTIASVAVTIHAPIGKVWTALVDPEQIKQYMFGSEVISDWKEGSAIVWKGEWKGKPFEDRGTVVTVQEPKLLRYEHASGDANGEDHMVTIELKEQGDTTQVLLIQDNNANDEARLESEKNWNTMLAGMKQLLEGQGVEQR